MNDVVEVTTESDRNLRTVGHISYALHAIVAVGAVVPGFQPGVLLLVAAFILDLVKRGDAAGTWQESHFRWRIHSVLWAAGLYLLISLGVASSANSASEAGLAAPAPVHMYGARPRSAASSMWSLRARQRG